MTFPKKHTRKITVNNQTYLWHLNQNRIDGSPTHVTIGIDGKSGQILFLDPYPWSFEIRPRTIQQAITWALEHGWNPIKKSPPLYLGYLDDKFFVLPAGVKFTYELTTDD